MTQETSKTARTDSIWSEPTRRYGFSELFDEIRRGAAQRDRQHDLPHAIFKQLARLKFGALRIPAALGGLGVSFLDFYAIIQDLATADSNIAHTLRNHFGLVERFLRAPGDSVLRKEIAKAANGEFFGFSYTEAASGAAGVVGEQVFLKPGDAGGYVLDGRRQYSTGNLYVDWIWLYANDAEGQPRFALIPTTRAGLDFTDDWDGIGQRLTGSGSTVFNGVQVQEDELIPLNDSSYTVNPKYSATFSQLYLTTIIVGIARAVQLDAVAEVHRRSRNYHHGLSPDPVQDANIQTTVGEIASYVYVLDAAVRESSRALDAAHAHAFDSWFDDGEVLDAAVKAAKTKVVVDEVAARLANLLFDAGGASAASQTLGYDRHWRNIRTVASHNPRTYKQRLVGRFELDGSPFPTTATFF